jgi:hypothetical protein
MKCNQKRSVLLLVVLGMTSPAWSATTFLHHFDNPLGDGANTADYAVGNPNQIKPIPFGFGGQIVSSPAKFGNSLLRTNGVDIGGRVEYSVAGNYTPNKGTIEMWINAPDILSGGFVGLWGTDTGTGRADIRMYIYDVAGVRTLGAYMSGAGGGFWEIEQPIPEGLLTSNVWHHVAWAFDMTPAAVADRKSATWWDGQLLRNTPDSGTFAPRTTFNNTLFHIGENQQGSAPFPGYIDEFRISDNIVYDTTQSFTPPSAPFTIPVVTTTWTPALGGVWATPASWSTGTTPNAVGAAAELTNTNSSSQTMQMNASTTLGTLRFSSPVTWVVGGTGSLTMDISSGSALIETTAGSHSISVPVTLNKSTTVNTASGTSLTITGSLSVASGLTLAKTSAGSLTVGGGISGGGNLSVTGGTLSTTNIRVSGLTVNGGTANATSGTSIVDSLTIGSGGTLNLGSADLIVHNGNAGTLGSLVGSWFSNGTKTGTGLKGSSAAYMTLAVFPNDGDGSIPYFTTFSGQSLSATDVLVKGTYIGDTNLDGKVDGRDYKQLNEGLVLGLSGWRNGDLNYDGVVNSADLALLNTSLNANLTPLTGFPTDDSGGIQAIPEPASMLPVVAVGLTGALRRRRK